MTTSIVVLIICSLLIVCLTLLVIKMHYESKKQCNTPCKKKQLTQSHPDHSSPDWGTPMWHHTKTEIKYPTAQEAADELLPPIDVIKKQDDKN